MNTATAQAMPDLFDLTPTEEQQMTRDVMRRFAADVITPAARAADEAAALPDGFLDAAFELGLNFMPVPEQFGGAGAGRSPVSNVLAMEDLAQGDMSLTLAALSPLAVINAVLDGGAPELQQRVCATLAGERFVPAAIAWQEPGIAFDPLAPETRAVRDGDDWVINGAKSMVLFGEAAAHLLVFAGIEGGVTGFVLDQDAAGLSFEREDYMGLRPAPLYRMQLDNVRVPADAKFSDGFDTAAALNRGRIAAAALAVGTCQAVLDYVVPYVNERVAFGEPVSNRQAVAFMVADMATELEALRLMMYRAASQAEQGMDCTRAAYLAWRQAIKYGMKTGTDGVQLLGGHGFIREHPVEMWYRNLRAIPLLAGPLLV